MFRISKEERRKAQRPLREKILESIKEVQTSTKIIVTIDKINGVITVDNPTSIDVVVNVK